VRRHFRHRPRCLEARRGARIVGVLPQFQTRSPLAGRALVSMPYAVYGGPLVDDAAVERALLDRLRALVDAERLRFAELRFRELPAAIVPEAGAGAGFAALAGSELYCTFLRELPADPEQCLEMIPRKSRATTRQARDRHGLRFVETPRDFASFKTFHRLFVLNKQRLGSPAFSLDWFLDVTRIFGARARLHFVLEGDAAAPGRVVVAVVSLLHGDTWNPYWSGSLPEADRLGASNFAYWQLMRTASAEGFRRFDFGRSRVDTGPWHFKRNMGFEPTPLPYRYLLGAGAAVPQVHPGNAKFSLPRRLLAHLPVPWIEAVGPRLMALVP
jgi:FemAB-related protein (PEP-CTERM system-associated)